MENFFTFCCLLSSILTISCTAQHTHPLSDSLQKVYTEKLSTYLAKDSAVAEYIYLSDTAITLFASSEKRRTGEFECRIYWNELNVYKTILQNFPLQAMALYEKGNFDLKNCDSLKKTLPDKKPAEIPTKPQPLKGKKIALDPGHFAGNIATAKVEGKYIQMELAGGQKIEFFESELAWYTAKILEEKLKALGAEVLLTRNAYNLTAFDDTFENWLKKYCEEKNLKQSLSQAEKNLLLTKEFLKPELAARADKINGFAPDLTLIIHYNVDANNTGWKQTVNKNFSMAFVGGAFKKDELSLPEQRFNLLRLLLTDAIPASIDFSAKVLDELKKQLKIPILKANNDQKFTEENCILTTYEGVYARNLTLARKIYGTICYIEPLLQDNLEECRKLNRRTLLFQGKKISPRLEEVAQVYLDAIVRYVVK